MGSQAALEGLARCVKTMPSMGPEIHVHARRTPPQSAQPGCEVVFGDVAALFDAPIHNGFVVGLAVIVYIPAVDLQKAQERVAQIVDDYARFRIYEGQRSNTLDGTPGVVEAKWTGLNLEDASGGPENTAMVQASMTVAAQLQIEPL